MIIFAAPYLIWQLKQHKKMENNKKSDILTVLENIDKMLQCYTTMVNSIAGRMQMLAIGIEAQSLASKLNLAAERWRYKLPFKEAFDVDFKLWEKKFDAWYDVFNIYQEGEKTDEIEFFEPNADHFIDQYFHERKLMETDVEECPFYMIDDAEEYDDLLWDYKRDIEEEENDWKNIIDNAAYNEFAVNSDLNIEDSLMFKQKLALMDWYFPESLFQLVFALHKAHEALLCPEEAAYKSLYERLSVAYFNQHIEEAKTSFQGWLSKTPKKRQLKMLKEKLEKEKAKFFSGKWKEALENYFDIEKVLEGTDAGKFIFKYREDLTLEEVGQIVGRYHKMACILEEISRLENKAEVKPVAKNAVTPQETKTMELSPIFARGIRESATATNQIVEAIREIAVTTSTPDRKLSGGKTWGHVKEALCLMGIIDSNCLGTEFGRAIEAICPDKKHTNVEQALKRYNSRKKTTTDENIATDIAKKLKAVVKTLTENA